MNKAILPEQIDPSRVPPVSGMPRVCLLSQRGLNRQLSRCCGYEFENVVSEMDRAEWVVPKHTRTSVARLMLRTRLSRSSQAYRLIDPAFEVSVEPRSYDLFFALVQFTRDLPVLDALKRFRSRSRVAGCLLEEVWLSSLSRETPQLAILRDFDFVFVSCAGSVDRLSNLIDRPVTYLPPAVDALKFKPSADRSRSIDVINIGRRSSVTHDALRHFCDKNDYFYHYDSLEGPFIARDPIEHRALLANLVRHSRYFIANVAKMDRAFETGLQPEIGFRFFEGLAGGTVVLGEPPETREFDEHLGWPRSVLRIPFDCPYIGDVIADLDTRPADLERIRRRNVCNILRRHDWLHRWQQVLGLAELEPTRGMAERHARLAAAAAMFDDGDDELSKEETGT